MKKTLAILAATLVAFPAMAETTPATTGALAGVPALSPQRVSGFVVTGYDTNYTGRGIVVSHSVAEGDSSEFIAARISYDFGKEKSYWTADTTLSYRVASSGHTLYGNPNMGDNVRVGLLAQGMAAQGASLAQIAGFLALPLDQQLAMADASGVPTKVKECNLENEFAVHTAINYTREKWGVSFGHNFVHGGILGVMAKHYRKQGASCTNEVFVKFTYTPAPWVEMGVTTDYSFQGITGWWFEPYVTFKAPIIGTPEDIKMAGRITFALTATADYFNEGYFACANGTQAFWIKIDTPIFLTEEKDVILTPYISFNWLGKGALKANEASEFRRYTGDHNNVPFRNFGVVAGVSVMYTF